MHRIALLALFASTLTGCQEAAPGSAGAVVETAGGAIVDPASGASCAGHDVRLTHDDFSVLLEGDCGEITVTGSNGSLNVTHARSLQVAGDRVTVINERVDTALVTGRNVTLNLTQVGQAELGGSDNLLMARQVDKLRFTGNDNTANVNNVGAVEDSGRGNKVL
jgi:hypothetical protein